MEILATPRRLGVEHRAAQTCNKRSRLTPEGAGRRAPLRGAKASQQIAVIGEFPQDLPVTPVEIALIKSFLSQSISAILTGEDDPK